MTTQKVQLTTPIKIEGVETSVIEMREPAVQDIIAVDKSAKSDAEKEVALLANLAQVAPSTIAAMSLRDYKKLRLAYRTLSGDDAPLQ